MRTLALALLASLSVWACSGDDAATTTATDSVADVGGDAVAADVGLADTPLIADIVADGVDVVQPGDAVVVEPPDLTEPLLPGDVRAGVVTDAAALFSGLKADGEVGDLKLYNAHVGFVVEGVRRADGFRYWGGNLADITLFGADGEPSEDLYGEAFFLWNLGAFEPQLAEVVSDGREGEAHVRLTGRTVALALTAGFFSALLDVDAPDLEVIYDYRLGPDDRALRLTITLRNPDPKALEVEWPIILANHGDGAFAFAPSAGFDTKEAIAVAIPSFDIVGRKLGYGVVVAEGGMTLFGTYEGLSLATLETFVLPGGGEATFERYFAASDNSVAGLDALRRQLLQVAQEPAFVEGHVTLPPSVAPETAYVAVVGPKDNDIITIAPVDADGAFSLELDPARDPTVVRAIARDHAISEDAPLDVIGLVPGETSQVQLEIVEAGTVTVSVTDKADGRPVPARVTFVRKGDTPTAHPPSATRLYPQWRDNANNVAYVIGDSATVTLPAGTYRAIATRGFSYEWDEADVTVSAGSDTALSLGIERVIDTSGWVSADFHVHAIGSMDSFVPWKVRAQQALTDDLDLPMVTEHDYVAEPARVADAGDGGGQLVGMAAQEVTTLEYGHFGAFPLVWDPDAVNNGAVFAHGQEPADLFAAIRGANPGDELIQVNHPRTIALGGYFTFVGYDSEDGSVREPERWSMDWDTIEVFSRDCGDTNNNSQTVADWTSMTNRGYRKTLASGSDVHDQWEAAGSPRNWIQADLAALRDDPQTLVAPVRGRRLFVTCGPFVRFEASDGTGLGGMTTPGGDGVVTFHAKVEAPTWMGVDEVRLLENGAVIAVRDVSAPTDPIVRFDDTFDVTPVSDAWYTLEVLGSGSMAPLTRAGPPYAMTNPIEVDADGDGVWTPPL